MFAAPHYKHSFTSHDFLLLSETLESVLHALQKPQVDKHPSIKQSRLHADTKVL
jgi:hypothetical protein